MKRTTLQRLLAWLLIAALGSPPWSAWARDTDIYRGTVTASSAAEPNVLLILDTSDSMNLPEGWKEYAGAYDSHVEYLWNDIDAISTYEVMTETAGKISTGNGYAPIPFWAIYVTGNYPVYTPLANKVLLMGLPSGLYSAGGTITLAGSPFAALNRTYTITGIDGFFILLDLPPGVTWDGVGGIPIDSGGNQYTWLWGPAMTASASSTGQVPDPTMALGFWGGNSSDARRQIWQAARDYAIATESGDPGPRSTYRNYAATDPNTGSALYWLPAGTNESYDPTNPAQTGYKGLYSNSFNRFLGADRMSRFGNVNGSNDPIYRGGINFGNLPAVYSSYNQCMSSKDQLTPSTVFAPSTVPNTPAALHSGKFLGQKWQRYERYLNLDNSLAPSYPGSNSATWSHYDGYLNANRDRDAFAVVGNVTMPIRLEKSGHRSDGGWNNLTPDWGGYHFWGRLWEIPDYPTFNQLLTVYGVPNAGIATLNDARIAGYKGLTVPGYYDSQNSVNAGGTTLTKTRSCSWTGQIGETDAGHTPVRGPATLYYGGTCSDGIVSCSDPGNPACGGLADPGGCNQAVADNFYTQDFNNCHWSGRNSLNTMTFSGCHWAGARLPVPLGEGAGTTYYYGGSCVGSCSGAECPAAVDGGTNYCVNAATTQTFGANSYDNVLQTTDPNTGCSNRTDNGATWYYGGSCIGDYRFPDGSTWNVTNDPAACNRTVTYPTPPTVDGVTLTDDARTDSSTAGCTDKNDTWQTCNDRHGANCPYQTCASAPSSTIIGGSNYTVYDRVADTDNVMVHDCVADELATAGPYMTQSKRDFGASWVSDSTPASNDANRTLSYDTRAARAIGTAPAYDVYSVNYLNWKYGPKSNGNPIGRKTRLQTTKDAMVQLVNMQDGVRFGLMVFNRMDNRHNTEGGNIVYAVRRMGTNNPADPAFGSAENTAALANRQVLINKINSLVAISQTPLTESLYEAYLYFNGAAPMFGRLATATPDGSRAAAGCDKNAFDNPGGGSDCLGSSGSYHSPMLDLLGSDSLPASCQKNYVLMMTDGGPENDWSANTAITSLRYEKSPTEVISPRTDVNTPVQSTPFNQYSPGGTAPSGPVDAGSAANDGGYIWLDELAYYMAKAKVSPASIPGVQSVSTYTVGFAGANSQVLKDAAAAGNGANYAANNPADLYSKLTGALDAIRAWQPISSGGTVVPISALNRAENSDNVYLGFFGPSLNIRWDGTLKKYLLSDVTTPGATGYCGNTPNTDGTVTPVTLCLTGQTQVSNDISEQVWNIEWVSNTPDAITGQSVSKVNDSAVSFWRPIAGAPDGGSARNGGGGQALMSSTTPATRNIYTFLSGVSGSSLMLSDNPLAEGNTGITTALLGNAGMSPATRATLINFARGGDPANAACSDANPATPCTAWRDWAHADILHSKPVVFDYGSGTQYAFYLSTDGTLHAVNTGDGTEKWAFTIEEALPLQNTLMTNNPGEHVIVADGSPSIYFDDANHDGLVNAGDRVMLYFGQRRGGSAYYALDITDINGPKFAWKIVGGMGPTGNGRGKLCVGSSCEAAADYDELGQTWSFPGVGKVRALTPPVAGTAAPAVIFGGGYDPNQDNDPPVAADTMGRALFIVNGYTGAVVRKFNDAATVPGIAASIPSDAAAMNTDLDAQNLLDRVYVGDMAGNLYRFDIDDALPANWTGGRIAQLSDGGTLRKILFAPALVKQQEMRGVSLAAFDAVYVGTGDREHPLKSSGTADKVFMIKDKPTVDSGYSLDATLSDLVDVTGFTGITAAADYATANTASKKGWFYSLPGAGEKVVSMPTVLNNVLRVSTFAPLENINSCVPPGRGQVYGMAALSGTPLDPTKYTMLLSNPRIFAGFFSQGYIGNAVPIIFHGKMYVMQVTESGQILPSASSIGSVAKVYWYREAER